MYELYDTNNRMSYNHKNFSVDRIKGQLPNTSRQRIMQTIFDFIVIIIVFACFVLVFALQDPKIRYFTCDESDIFYPFLPDTIPYWAVIIYGVIGPLLLITFVEFLNARLFWCQKKKKNHALRSFYICLFHGISLFVLGLGIVMLLTEIGKRWVGRLRPHFMDVCKPDLTKVKCLNGVLFNPIYTGDNFCTGDPARIKEARLSFPSGHSSFSWYTMAFVVIYLEARFILVKLRYMKTLLQMIAFITAYVTMLSRVSDYYHRASDVIAGTFLGLIVAFAITLFVGRVLWVYEKKHDYIEIDLRTIEEKNSINVEIN